MPSDTLVRKNIQMALHEKFVQGDKIIGKKASEFTCDLSHMDASFVFQYISRILYKPVGDRDKKLSEYLKNALRLGLDPAEQESFEAAAKDILRYDVGTRKRMISMLETAINYAGFPFSYVFCEMINEAFEIWKEESMYPSSNITNREKKNMQADKEFVASFYSVLKKAYENFKKKYSSSNLTQEDLSFFPSACVAFATGKKDLGIEILDKEKEILAQISGMKFENRNIGKFGKLIDDLYDFPPMMGPVRDFLKMSYGKHHVEIIEFFSKHEESFRRLKQM